MNEEVYASVRKCLKAVSRKPLPEGHDEFVELHLVDDLGLDSLDIVAFHFDLEESLGIEIPESEIAPRGLSRVSNLLEYLSR